MKEITLTQGKVAMVDGGDFEYLNQFKWYARKNGCCYYALRHLYGKYGKPITMHFEIMGQPPKGMLQDHKDGNGLNNQKGNLRFCTVAQNQWNSAKQKDNQSGYKGVHLAKGRRKWTAQIMVNGEKKYLGRFHTPQEAAIAFNEAALKYHGEFARLNHV
jgi:hypothetical protein